MQKTEKGTVTRRNVLGMAGGLAGSLVLGRSTGQDSAASKGPLVWLDMDQAGLDAAYDQSVYAPSMAEHVERRDAQSRAVRERLGGPRRFAYGSTPVEALDVFTAAASPAPVQVFIHGGAWRGGLAHQHESAAGLFVDHGAHFVVPEFAWVQDVAGDLSVLAAQVRRALAWVYENAASFGGDPERIYVSGHSSGGHLAGVLLTTDWPAVELPADIIKAGLLCSGLFDLEPVRLSARNGYLTITEGIERSLSPQRNLHNLSAPLIVAYGTKETPEFQRQSRDFAAAVQAAGKPVELLVGEGYNHFEIIETLADPDGPLGRAALEQMQLKG